MTAQPPIAYFFGKRSPAASENEPPKFVDLFCGIGGASTGAVAAGYSVVLAVDHWRVGLDAHKQNHPECEHLLRALPSADLPLPSGRWHLHASPPCVELSLAKLPEFRTDENTEASLDLIRWSVDLALSSSCESWSLEQVGTAPVRSLMRALKKANPTKLDFDIFDFSAFGVPQTRTRLLAGTPRLIAKLRRLPPVKSSARDWIQAPRSSMTKNNAFRNYALTRDAASKKARRILRVDECARSVDEPAHTVLASSLPKWIFKDRFVRFTPSEAARLQTFPENYILPGAKSHASRGVGNALPPLVMKLLLQRDKFE